MREGRTSNQEEVASVELGRGAEHSPLVRNQVCRKPMWCALKGGSGGREANGNLIPKRENHQNILYNYVTLKKNIDPVVYIGEREGSLKATDGV